MIPALADLDVALEYFSASYMVRDYRYVITDGQDVPVLTGTRTVQAAVDPTRSRSMERAFGGSLGDGDVGIFTRSDLYPGDSPLAGETQRQSFFEYGGLSYRVSEVALWKPLAGFNVYLGKRHVGPEGVG